MLGSLGNDPTRLVFHDELTDLRNRRFLNGYFENHVRWRTGEDFPISLIVLDVDDFKRVNDSRGHLVGDRALTWVADLLRETVGEAGIPIRYAGDEFVVILPDHTRDRALQLAERVIAASRRQPFRPADGGASLRLTVSVGVASAPEDAVDATGLFQAADQALYQSKESGRDRATSAAELDAERVFPHAALQHLRDAGLGGREEEFLVVSRALESLRAGRNGFVLFEGGLGMGKTALLDAVAGRIADVPIYRLARAEGDRREALHPFYLTRRLLGDLIARRENEGENFLESLEEEDRRRLALLVPGSEVGPDEAVEEGRRDLFETLTRAFTKVVDSHPLVLLIDDLHLADQATLRLLRTLWFAEGIDVLVVACALDAGGAPDSRSPLDAFLASDSGEIGVRRARLRPLDGEDVELHLQKLFPGLRLPLGFAEEIVRATAGNPLFISEIVRELIADHKIAIRGSRWTAARLEPGHLPRSVEEIVQRRIGELPAEDRQLLERAAAIGEHTSLDMLVRSSHEDEGRVLDFLDRAETLGLVRLEFQDGEETLRFLGKRVMEVSYEAIEEGRRADLHEQIGTYSEELYDRGALASASLPAWQYERAGNTRKAERFHEIRREEARRVFDPANALDSVGELVETEDPAEAPLDPQSLPLLPRLIRAFTKAVRDVRLYPAQSQAVIHSTRSLHDAIAAILADNERLHVSHGRGALLVNGRRTPLPDATSQAEAFVDLLGAVELQGVTFLRGLDQNEVHALVSTMGALRKDVVSPGFWNEVVREEGFSHVLLEQVQYTRVVKRRVAGSAPRPSIDDSELDAAAMKRLPRVLRALQSAVRTTRLYDIDTPAASVVVDRLGESLEDLLDDDKALTLAEVDGTLLVNGRRAEIGGGIADEIAGFLTESGLESVSFLPRLPRAEIEAFLGAIRDLPAGAHREHWSAVEQELGLRHVVFDARRFAAPAVSAVVTVPGREDRSGPVDPIVEEARRRSAESGAALIRTLPGMGRQLLAKGEPELLRRLVERALEGYASQEAMSRELALQAFESLFDSLTIGLQHELSALAADPLLEALSQESESSVLEVHGKVLQEMIGVSIQLGDTPLASRILEALEARRRDLAWDPSDSRARLLDRPLEPAVRMTLLDRFRSREPEERRQAARVIGSMGPSRLPLLVEVVQTEPDLSIRATAATLLSEAGPRAGREFSRALATETIIERRIRMLEVVDTVTEDVHDVLRDALADADLRVRDAGLRLFERVRRDDLVDLVLPLARGSDVEAAAAAIQSLAVVRSPNAIEALTDLQRSDPRPGIVIACCRALGRLDGPVSVDALVGVLRRKRLGVFGPRWDESMRSAAASVLREMDDPRARQALASLLEDPHASVREIALAATGSRNGS